MAGIKDEASLLQKMEAIFGGKENLKVSVELNIRSGLTMSKAKFNWAFSKKYESLSSLPKMLEMMYHLPVIQDLFKIQLQALKKAQNEDLSETGKFYAKTVAQLFFLLPSQVVSCV